MIITGQNPRTNRGMKVVGILTDQIWFSIRFNWFFEPENWHWKTKEPEAWDETKPTLGYLNRQWIYGYVWPRTTKNYSNLVLSPWSGLWLEIEDHMQIFGSHDGANEDSLLEKMHLQPLLRIRSCQSLFGSYWDPTGILQRFRALNFGRVQMS